MVRHICPPDHQHELAITCASNHGCRCDPCLLNRSEYDRRKRILSGGTVLVDAGPTRRRLQALARHGWGCNVISLELKMGRNKLRDIRDGRQLRARVGTAERVAAFYAEYAMRIAPRNAVITRLRNVAKARGWRSPMEWADIERGELD